MGSTSRSSTVSPRRSRTSSPSIPDAVPAWAGSSRSRSARWLASAPITRTTSAAVTSAGIPMSAPAGLGAAPSSNTSHDPRSAASTRVSPSSSTSSPTAPPRVANDSGPLSTAVSPIRVAPTRPPTTAAASNSSTESPALASSRAATRPPMPAPTTATSVTASARARRCGSAAPGRSRAAPHGRG